MHELLPFILTLYLSCAVSFALYAIGLLNTIALVSNTSKSSKSRKLLVDLEKDTKLYLKLCPVWPFIICHMIIRKLKG